MPYKDRDKRKANARKYKRANADSINRDRRVRYLKDADFREKAIENAKRRKLTPAQKIAKSERESRRRSKKRKSIRALRYLETRSILSLYQLENPTFIVEEKSGRRRVEHWNHGDQLEEANLDP